MGEPSEANLSIAKNMVANASAHIWCGAMTAPVSMAKG